MAEPKQVPDLGQESDASGVAYPSEQESPGDVVSRRMSVHAILDGKRDMLYGMEEDDLEDAAPTARSVNSVRGRYLLDKMLSSSLFGTPQGGYQREYFPKKPLDWKSNPVDIRDDIPHMRDSVHISTRSPRRSTGLNQPIQPK